MRFGKRKTETKAPAETKTTAQALQGDGAKATSGVGKVLGGTLDIVTGTISAGWHSYTSIYNTKAKTYLAPQPSLVSQPMERHKKN